MHSADRTGYYLKAGVLGGLAGGALSAIPYVNLCNIVCCMWVLGAGVLAVYLIQRWSNEPVTPGGGASVGVLAGLVAGIVQSVVFAAMAPGQMREVQSHLGNVPPEMRPMLEQWFTGEFFITVVVVFILITFTIFGTLGGLLGAAILGRRE